MPDLSQIRRLLANICALLRVKLEMTGSLPIGSGSGEVLRQWVRTASWLGCRIRVSSAYPKRVDKVIEKEEAHIQRLQIDALSERKQSLVTDLVAKQEKVNELQQGKVIPLTTLYVVRIWHRDPDILAARAASLKNAFISMGGATIHHATIPENARQLFFQTWPGWTFGTYRALNLISTR